MKNLPLLIRPDIKDALAANKPVVALESTIITHGMPFPANLETANDVEQRIRDCGAMPATVAVINGDVKVGLAKAEMEELAHSDDVMKLSRADLAMAVARSANGSTTVAATMIIAKLAGIPVFATGGIGGVHRGASSTFDVSADLQELSRTNVTVVCAGAKAILDLPKTMEVLETLGVPVIAYQQDNLPAFWSCNSSLKAPLRADSVEEIVRFIRTRASLRIDGGVLIANPVPKEFEISADEMDGHIGQATSEAKAEGVSGKSVTPWLLARITELTQGKSLTTNRNLIINNAALAAELAIDLVEN